MTVYKKIHVIVSSRRLFHIACSQYDDVPRGLGKGQGTGQGT